MISRTEDEFACERYPVILSTHSAFLVSDLPGTHVNKIGTDIEDVTPTLAANLLELLLSPLFLENWTGTRQGIAILGVSRRVSGISAGKRDSTDVPRGADA